MKLTLSLAALIAMTSAANAFSISIGFGADGSNAVVCNINEVAVLAQSDADCATLGGEVTHTIDSTPAS